MPRAWDKGRGVEWSREVATLSQQCRAHPWTPSRWLEVRQRILNNGHREELRVLTRAVQTSTTQALSTGCFQTEEGITIDLSKHVSQVPKVSWFGRENVIVPEELFAHTVATRGTPCCDPPLIVASASPLEVACQLATCGEGPPARRLTMVAEVSDFATDGSFVQAAETSASLQNLAFCSDFSRFMEVAQGGAMRQGAACSVRDHLRAPEDPYIVTCADLTIFRRPPKEGYAFMHKPFHVDCLVTSMPNARPALSVARSLNPSLQTEWYASETDQKALLERLNLFGLAALQDFRADVEEKVVLILSGLGCDRGQHPRDAVANSLKHWRRRFAKLFHCVIVACGPDVGLTMQFDEVINCDIYEGSSICQAGPALQGWHWDERYLGLHIRCLDFMKFKALCRSSLMVTTTASCVTPRGCSEGQRRRSSFRRASLIDKAEDADAIVENSTRGLLMESSTSNEVRYRLTRQHSTARRSICCQLLEASRTNRCSRPSVSIRMPVLQQLVQSGHQSSLSPKTRSFSIASASRASSRQGLSETMQEIRTEEIDRFAEEVTCLQVRKTPRASIIGLSNSRRTSSHHSALLSTTTRNSLLSGLGTNVPGDLQGCPRRDISETSPLTDQLELRREMRDRLREPRRPSACDGLVEGSSCSQLQLFPRTPEIGCETNVDSEADSSSSSASIVRCDDVDTHNLETERQNPTQLSQCTEFSKDNEQQLRTELQSMAEHYEGTSAAYWEHRALTCQWRRNRQGRAPRSSLHQLEHHARHHTGRCEREASNRFDDGINEHQAQGTDIALAGETSARIFLPLLPQPAKRHRGKPSRLSLEKKVGLRDLEAAVNEDKAPYTPRSSRPTPKSDDGHQGCRESLLTPRGIASDAHSKVPSPKATLSSPKAECGKEAPNIKLAQPHSSDTSSSNLSSPVWLAQRAANTAAGPPKPRHSVVRRMALPEDVTCSNHLAFFSPDG